MMLTFLLEGHCAECGSEAKGSKMSFPERINLNSIRVKQSLTFWKRDCAHHGADVVVDGHMRLTEESKELVEQARDKIRARRKRKAS